MTFNWGHKLLLAFAVFAGLIGYLVFRSMHTNFDLVTKEYYKDELVYQQVIDGSKRAGALGSKITIAQQGKTVIVAFPQQMEYAGIGGSILFYCAADAKKDRDITIKTSGSARQEIAAGTILPGIYTVKISWKSGGSTYYTEEDFVLH